MKLDQSKIIALSVVVAAFIWVRAKGAKEVGAQAASLVIDLADGVVSEPVFIVGEAVGIPRTDQTACEKAMQEGRTWDASFACPAGDFIKYVFN